MTELEQIRTAWQVLAEGAPRAAEELVRLSTGARSEFVRLQAAGSVLDRTGLGSVTGVVVGEQQLTPEPELEDGGAGQAAQILAARMRALTQGTARVVDGAVVDPVTGELPA